METNQPAAGVTSALPAQTAATPGQGSGSSATDRSRKALTQDFETFLSMLTAQMKYQDPLDPMKAQEFAVQLATFSGVEQQVRTNEILGDVARELEGTRLAQMAGWIGRDVAVTGPVIFRGGSVRLRADVVEGADRAVLVVKDGSGAVVQREPIAAVSGEIGWVGRDASGKPLPDGSYTIEVESYSEGKLLESRAVESFHRIVEVRRTGEGERLIADDGGAFGLDDVTSVRGLSRA